MGAAASTAPLFVLVCGVCSVTRAEADVPLYVLYSILHYRLLLIHVRVRDREQKILSCTLVVSRTSSFKARELSVETTRERVLRRLASRI